MPGRQRSPPYRSRHEPYSRPPHFDRRPSPPSNSAHAQHVNDTFAHHNDRHSNVENNRGRRALPPQGNAYRGRRSPSRERDRDPPPRSRYPPLSQAAQNALSRGSSSARPSFPPREESAAPLSRPPPRRSLSPPPPTARQASFSDRDRQNAPSYGSAQRRTFASDRYQDAGPYRRPTPPPSPAASQQSSSRPSRHEEDAHFEQRGSRETGYRTTQLPRDRPPPRFSPPNNIRRDERRPSPPLSRRAPWSTAHNSPPTASYDRRPSILRNDVHPAGFGEARATRPRSRSPEYGSSLRKRESIRGRSPSPTREERDFGRPSPRRAIYERPAKDERDRINQDHPYQKHRPTYGLGLEDEDRRDERVHTGLPAFTNSEHGSEAPVHRQESIPTSPTNPKPNSSVQAAYTNGPDGDNVKSSSVASAKLLRRNSAEIEEGEDVEMDDLAVGQQAVAAQDTAPKKEPVVTTNAPVLSVTASAPDSREAVADAVAVEKDEAFIQAREEMVQIALQDAVEHPRPEQAVDATPTLFDPSPALLPPAAITSPKSIDGASLPVQQLEPADEGRTTEEAELGGHVATQNDLVLNAMVQEEIVDNMVEKGNALGLDDPSEQDVRLDFDSVLKNVAAEAEHRSLPFIAGQDAFIARKQLDTNDTQSQKTSRAPFQDLTNVVPISFLQIHSHVLPQLFDQFAKDSASHDKRIARLQKTYRELDSEWKKHVQAMEKMTARSSLNNAPGGNALQQSHGATPGLFGMAPPGTPSNTDPTAFGFPFAEDHGTPFSGSVSVNGVLGTPGPLSSRASRRGLQGGFGDAVRSEAQMQEIMAYLETVEAQDPTVRAARTAAVVPPMLSPKSVERSVLEFDDNNSLVEDPEEFYGSAPVSVMRADPAAVEWNDEEVQIFCRRFGQYPKQFGKIASYLENKTTAQCVLFYYRSKKVIPFKAFADRRVGGRRRRAKLNKGSSLLADLQPSRKEIEDANEAEEEEDTLPDHQAALRSPEITFGYRSLRTDQVNEDLVGMGQKILARMLSGVTRRTELEAARAKRAAKAAEAAAATAPEDEQPDGNETDSDREVDAAEMQIVQEKRGKRKRAQASSYWTAGEKQEFLRLLPIHGKVWADIADVIRTKTWIQCRNFYTNNRLKMSLERYLPGADIEDGGDDANPSDQETIDDQLKPPIDTIDAEMHEDSQKSRNTIDGSNGLSARAPSGMSFLLNATQDEGRHAETQSDWFGNADATQRSPRRSSGHLHGQIHAHRHEASQDPGFFHTDSQKTRYPPAFEPQPHQHYYPDSRAARSQAYEDAHDYRLQFPQRPPYYTDAYQRPIPPPPQAGYNFYGYAPPEAYQHQDYFEEQQQRQQYWQDPYARPLGPPGHFDPQDSHGYTSYHRHSPPSPSDQVPDARYWASRR